MKTFAVLAMALIAPADVGVSPDPFKPSVEIEAREWTPGIQASPGLGSTAIGNSRPPREAACGMPDRIETTWRCGWWDLPGEEPDVEAPEGAELTAAQVRRAVREIPMPALEVRVQPGERTLVNVPTIFYTEPRAVRESVTLLGHRIEVEATAVSYRWHHGDGSSQRTWDPGAAHPHESVTHAYEHTADRVSPRVDVTYSVRYRVDGGPWTPLGEDLTAAGPSTTLEVDEAAPVLVRP